MNRLESYCAKRRKQENCNSVQQNEQRHRSKILFIHQFIIWNITVNRDFASVQITCKSCVCADNNIHSFYVIFYVLSM